MPWCQGLLISITAQALLSSVELAVEFLKTLPQNVRPPSVSALLQLRGEFAIAGQ